MIRFKHFLGFNFCIYLCIFLCTDVQAKPTINHLSSELSNNSGSKIKAYCSIANDTVNVFASSANGSVGDIVTLNISVSNFTNVTNLSFSVNWSATLLQYQSVNNLNLPNLLPSNFDVSQTSGGALGMTWNGSGSPQTYPDGTIIFTVQFMILASSGVPTPIVFSDIPTPIKCIKNTGPSYIRVNQGQVFITNTCSSRPASLRCQSAPVLCPSELPYCGTLPTANNQTSLRVGCGSIENNIWIAFDAGTTDMVFRIKVSNCNGGGDGIQVRVLQTSDCLNFNLLACKFQIIRSGEDTLEVNNLTVGNRYYFLIDGYNGDVCDYKILLESGSLIDFSYVTPDFDGSFNICPNAKNISFAVKQPLSIVKYEWKIPATVTANTALTGSSINVNWGTVSDSVCVRNIGRCDTSRWICKNVAFAPPVTSEFSARKCKNACYTFNGQSYCNTGDYTATLKTSQGCDSIVTLHLSNLPPLTYTLNAVTCTGVPYIYRGKSFTSSGDYVFDPITTASGCDSIVTVHLTVSPALSGNINAIVCSGGTYLYNGKNYSTGDYSVNVPTSLGCDSIVALHLTVAPTLTGSFSASICPGNTYTYNGKNYSAGTYSVNVPTASGCDSIVAFHLTNSDTLRSSQNASICNGSCYSYNGQSYCVAGDYFVKLKSPQGCDSIVTLHISVTQTLTGSLDTSVCTGTSIVYAGKTYSTPGDYTIPFKTAQGCDSIVTLHFKNYAPATGSFDTVICSGTNFVYAGKTFTTTGNYSQILSRRSIHGCDSTVNFNLTVLNVGVTASSSGDVNCTSPTSTLTSTLTGVTPSGATVEYIWKDAAGNIFGGNVSAITVSQSGTFSVAVKTSLKNKTCTSNPFSIVIKRTGNLPIKPVIQLPNRFCQNQSFTVTASSTTADVSSYAWTITNGGTFSGATNTANVTATISGATAQICVAAVNGCGKSDTSCTTITPVTPPELPAITGTSSICPNLKTTYTVSNPITGIIYNWTATNGGLNGAAYDVKSVEVNWANTDGKICVSAANTCFTSQPNCLDVKIKSTVPDSVPIITAKTNFCSNDSTTYSVNPDNSVTQFVWQVPQGGTIISGVNTKSIRVVWQGNASGTISVDMLNVCQLKRTVSLPINVRDATLNAPNITGASVTCPGSTTFYYIPAQNNVTYKWRIPSDAIALTRLDSNGIKIQWSNVSGDVCIDMMNDCQVKKSSCINVQVKSSLDSLPITGDVSVCADSIGHFSVQNDPNAGGYFWRLPPGASIISGRGTSDIVARFPKGSGGLVICVPNGGCADGNRSSLVVTLRDAPVITGNITGKTVACVGDTLHYNIASVSNASGYLWRVSDGATFITNKNTPDIGLVVTKAQLVQLCVVASGDCQPSAEKCTAINVNAQPQPYAGNDTSICATQFNLNALSTGGTLTWRVLNKPTNALVNISSQTNRPRVTVSQPGVYDFELNESNSVCSNTSKVRITVTQPPVMTDLIATCSADETQYRVAFNILTNGSNNIYAVKGSTGGTLSGTNFNSLPIAQNTDYWFVVNDNTGCVSDTMRGKPSCNCVTKAPSITIGAGLFCYGTSAQFSKQNDGQISAGDIYEYILHDGTATTIGNIILRNTTGTFSFNAGTMQYGRTYYVVLAVGEASKDAINGVSTVNLQKRCTSLSNSLALRFKDKIIATLAGDTTICGNTDAKIYFSVTTTNPIGTYAGSCSSSTETFNFKNLSSPNVLIIKPTLSGIFKLLSFTDADKCPVISTDSVKISIRPVPTADAGTDQSTCLHQALLNGNAKYDGKDALTGVFTGIWQSLTKGPLLTDSSKANTTVGNLQNGKNTFVWSVTDNVCPAYQARATVNIFLALVPKANKLGLETFAGDTVHANLIEATPPGTYTIRRLNDPTIGRFEYFSNGAFNFMTDSTESGIAKFQVLTCSVLCTNLCDTGDVRILVKSRPHPVDTTLNNITVPNAFTPNGDGKNDYFVVDGVDKFPANELVVFNRWGEIVYRAKPYNNDWGGNNQSGAPLPEGTYYYVLRLNINDGKVLSGDVTIMK